MTEAAVSFAGNLTDDPELRHTEGGIARAMFRVAVSGRREQEPSFFTVIVWRDQAEHVAESLGRGSRVVVVDRLQHRTWTAEDGSARSTVEVVTDELGPSLRPPDHRRGRADQAVVASARTIAVGAGGPCAFCGRPREVCAKLIAGPELFVCDRCVVQATRLAAGGAVEDQTAGSMRLEASGSEVRCSFCGKQARKARHLVALVFSDGRYLLRLAGGAPPGWIVPTTPIPMSSRPGRRRRGSCGSGSCPSRSTRNAWSWSTMGPWRSGPASSSPRRSTTGTRTGSRSAPS
jgi:single-strand DNA-binding protein